MTEMTSHGSPDCFDEKKTNYYMGMFIERGERESRTFRVKLERKRAIMSGIKDLFKIVHKVLH